MSGTLTSVTSGRMFLLARGSPYYLEETIKIKRFYCNTNANSGSILNPIGGAAFSDVANGCFGSCGDISTISFI